MEFMGRRTKGTVCCIAGGAPGGGGRDGGHTSVMYAAQKNPKCDRWHLDSTGFQMRGALFDAAGEVCGATVSRRVKCFVLACLFN